ncbi:putative protein ABIL3 isoform X3 [Canna indica]|uniref:Uncharacterized protein n=1 Tax=Canna indica TaxID=4628 RepID=A0AAQ3KM51_9LILI|nr:putative protein ABIL3 isoform X3 [Canna indica]
MEATSPSFSSLSAGQHEASSLDDAPVQQSLLLSESLKVLRNMRSQLYSAAEYFELSYIKDEQKEIVSRTLKDYAVKAIANAVEHLGSVSNKVNNLLSEEVLEVSVAEFEVSCIEQRLRTCQACADQEGFSQQSLSTKPPRYHKHYILQGGESVADQSIMKYQGLYPLNENRKVKQHRSATRRRPPPVRNNVISQNLSPSPSARELCLSATPLPQLEISYSEIRAASSLQASNPSTHARSAANRPIIPYSSKKYILESQNSLPTSLHAERSSHKEMERNTTKKRGFLKSLLKKNRSWTDESLYSYLDEY